MKQKGLKMNILLEMNEEIKEMKAKRTGRFKTPTR